jgi:hypothetical protein
MSLFKAKEEPKELRHVRSLSHTGPGYGGGHCGDWKRIKMLLKCVFKSNRRAGMFKACYISSGGIYGEDQGEGVFSVWFIPGKMEARGL